ncbi:hypothetical protein C8Q75DRAFT_808193 [Abortiporus biennis]|nr:hypothetical protein C8Q75DRAFT_808193 [Abortiporus biennis]
MSNSEVVISDDARISSSNSTGLILTLPSEIILEICGLLLGPELVYFAQTCKILYAFLREPYLWRKLCSQHGVVDPSRYGVKSFFTVYTQLLYPFGPLLGLWANDHPYSGNILQFILWSGSGEENGGILGGVWRFPDPDSHSMEDGLPVFCPGQPVFVNILKIELHEDEQRASISCIRRPEAGFQPHRLTMTVAASSSQGLFLQTHRRSFTHTPFPGRSPPWLDQSARRLPRLIPTHLPPVDQRGMANMFPAIQLPILFSAPVYDTSPASLVLDCDNPTTVCELWHQPRITFDGLLPYPPSYFPIHPVIQRSPTSSPDSSAVEYRLLEGLWLYVDGRHGTQCLYIETQDSDNNFSYLFRAWKITGDAYVPRGEVKWSVTGEVNSQHIYRGAGVVGDRGFLVKRHGEIIVEIQTMDRIRVSWVDQHDIQLCVRYTSSSKPSLQ